MTSEQALIAIAAAFFVAACCQWLAWRVNVPAILFLLVAGVIAGPVSGAFQPELLMGELFLPFISLSVAIILFEGSITLKFQEIKGLQGVLRNMLSFGLVITWVITTLAARLITGIGWEIAFLFGAITVVTGPTVISPLLRAVRPTPSVAGILRWEGIVIDPIGASLAVLVYEYILAESTQQAWSRTLVVFLQIVSIGAVIGIAAGYLFGLVLRNRLLPDFLENVTTLAMIFATFVLADVLQPESGLVTVTVFGMWLANMPGVRLDEILRFKESLSTLLISLLFLMLTARLDMSALTQLGWSALAVFFVIQFLARPASVLLCSIGSSLRREERLFLSWVAPRGIVAAAISSLFALKLEHSGFADATLLVPLTFTVIIGTILLQSSTSLPLARWLNIAVPQPQGILIIGANRVARAIGSALVKRQLTVLLADIDETRIKAAQREGLRTYLGNPLPDYTDPQLNLSGIGTLLAVTPDDTINSAAALRYRQELGRDHVFILPGSQDSSDGCDLGKAALGRYANLLCGSAGYPQLAELLDKGGRIVTHDLASDATVNEIRHSQIDGSIPLFAIDPKNRLTVIASNTLRKRVVKGATLYVLVPKS